MMQMINTGLSGNSTTWEVYSKSTQSVDTLVRVENSAAYNVTTPEQILTLNAVSYDVGQNFNVTNNRFICKTPGYYLFTTSFETGNGSVGQGRYLMFYKNGVRYEVIGNVQVSIPNGFSVAGSTIIKLQVGDYVTLVAGSTSGTYPVSKVFLNAIKVSD